MLVSVITTTFNSLPFLPEAVESVLGQTHAEFEYVLVDDGSTDATADVMAQVADSRLRYIRSQRVGRAAALNLALAEARGQFVANLDADDLMLPERLACQRAFLDAHPQVGMVGSACYLHHPDGSSALTEPLVHDADLRKRLFVGYPFVHSSVMYRRDALASIGGFDTSLACCIDYAACTRITRDSRLANLSDPLAVRRVHGQNYFMLHVSPRQYFAAVSRIKWRYWNDSGRPLTALPSILYSLALGGLRKWIGQRT
jgi:glycosyltransferase involved in cell wall biosynthesis